MKPQFEVFARIVKPIDQVFAAVYEPQQLQKYFTTKSASAPLKEGTTVEWEFQEHEGKIPVEVKKTEKNKRIVFEWGSGKPGQNATVDITFKAMAPSETKVTISESGWDMDEAGLKRSYGNCFGWTQMLCCLKAYLEYGINLREGFFKIEDIAA